MGGGSRVDIDEVDNIVIITFSNPPENRLTVELCQQLIKAYRQTRLLLGRKGEGALILRGSGEKFFSTGIDIEESTKRASASSEGLFPLVHTVLDFPYPTICLINGHAFGGACLLTLAHDYRIMNQSRGYWCMPPVDLGLHFDGIGSLLNAKLAPQTRRAILLEAHRYKASEARQAGIIDAATSIESLLEEGKRLAQLWKPKSKAGVYCLLRAEILGPAVAQFAELSNNTSGETTGKPLVSKI